MSLPHCHSEVQTVNNPFTDLFLAFIIAGGISIILLHTLGEVKTHRFCVCDPKATHTIAFIALPNALHSGTNGVNQILVGDADRGLLLTLRLGELVAPLLTTLTHTNRKNLVFCVKLAQDKSRIVQVIKYLFRKGDTVLVNENVGVCVGVRIKDLKVQCVKIKFYYGNILEINNC